MKVFVLKVDNLTDNWHSEGGLVVIAESLEHAKTLIDTYPGYRNKPYQPKDAEWDAAFVADLVSHPEEEAKVFVFPNAGCC